MRWSDILERAEELLPPPRMIGFPCVQHRLYLLALQPVLATAKVTGNDWISHIARKSFAIRFGDMSQRAVNEEIPVLVDEFRRHGRQPTAMKEVKEKRLENIVAVVTENDR